MSNSVWGAARRHQVFECPKKSQRGPEVAQHLKHARRLLSERVTELLAVPVLADHDDLRNEVRKSYEKLQSDRTVGQRMLDAWETHSGACRGGLSSQLHRVTQKFTNPVGTLRRHLQACRNNPFQLKPVPYDITSLKASCFSTPLKVLSLLRVGQRGRGLSCLASFLSNIPRTM